MVNKSGSKGRGREMGIETFQPEVKLPEEKALKIEEGLYEEIRGGDKIGKNFGVAQNIIQLAVKVARRHKK